MFSVKKIAESMFWCSGNIRNGSNMKRISSGIGVKTVGKVHYFICVVNVFVGPKLSKFPRLTIITNRNKYEQKNKFCIVSTLICNARTVECF